MRISNKEHRISNVEVKYRNALTQVSAFNIHSCSLHFTSVFDIPCSIFAFIITFKYQKNAMNLLSTLKQYADQIGWQFTDYDHTKTVIVVSIDSHRFQTVLALTQKSRVS